MKDKYIRVKGRYKDAIVLVKSGYFWNTFYGDAVILHGIMGYALKSNKLGFPAKVLDKVKINLQALNISFILVYELDDIIVYSSSSNLYTFYLNFYQK